MIHSKLFKPLQQLPVSLRLTLIYGFSLVVTKAVALIMVPFTTHFLAPADYGRLDVLQTLADLLSIVIGMGLADTLFRFAGMAKSDEERKVVTANLVGMALLIGAVTFFLTQISAPWIATLLPGDISVVQTRLILGSLALGGVSTICLSWLRMCDLAGFFFSASVGRVILQAVLSAALLILGFGVTGVMAAGFIAAAAMFLGLFFYQWHHTGIRFDFKLMKGYAIYGVPLIFAGMSGFILGSFDRWILAEIVGTAEMAQYALAAKFGLITAMMIQPFDMWWLPKRFKVLKAEGGELRCAQLGAIGVSIGIIAAVCVAAIGPLLIEVLTPSSYHQATKYVPWMAVLAVLHNVNTNLGLGCYNCRTTTWPALIDAMAAAVAVIGYIVLIPRWGIEGTIVATAVALSLRLLVTITISQRITPLPYAGYRLAILAIVALGAITILQLSQNTIDILLFGTLGSMLVTVAAFSLELIPLPPQLRFFSFLNFVPKSQREYH